MTRYTLRQLQNKRKDERRAHMLNMVGAILFALAIGSVFFFAR